MVCGVSSGGAAPMSPLLRPRMSSAAQVSERRWAAPREARRGKVVPPGG